MFPKIEDPERLTTPLGEASEVWATSDTHIGMRGTFTINRVPYNVRLDLHYRDGEWQPGSEDNWSSRWHALMLDREWDWTKGSRPDPSTAARQKAYDALIPWLAEFAVGEGATMIREAGQADRRQKIESKRAQLQKLHDEIEQAERDLAELEASE